MQSPFSMSFCLPLFKVSMPLLHHGFHLQAGGLRQMGVLDQDLLPDHSPTLHSLGQLIRSPSPRQLSLTVTSSTSMSKVLGLCPNTAFIHSFSVHSCFGPGPQAPPEWWLPSFLGSMDPFRIQFPSQPSASLATALSQAPLSCGQMDNGLSQLFILSASPVGNRMTKPYSFLTSTSKHLNVRRYTT